MKGNVRTTGIARYSNKFNISVEPYQNSFLVSLTPLVDADFNFYIDFGTLCPSILSKVTLSTGCVLTLDYNSTAEIRLGTKLLNFNASAQTVENINFGAYNISVNNDSCLIVTCEAINEVTTVVLQTPNFQLISDATQSVLGDIQLFENLNDTINTINSIETNIDDANEQIKNIGLALSLLNFNVSDEYQFKNFSDLRAQVDYLMSVLNHTHGDEIQVIDTDSCSSVFGSIKCFFNDFMANLIVIGVVIVIAIVGYLLIFKLKVCKKCCK